MRDDNSKTSSISKIILAFLILISVIGASTFACTGLLNSDTIDTIHAPSDFTATAGSQQNMLLWNMESSNYQVLIKYNKTGQFTSVTDGELVYRGNETSYTHIGLDPGERYYYAIWSARLVEGEWVYSSDNALASAIPYWSGSDGEKIREYVEKDGARMVGADGEYIELVNNTESHNPTWEELKQFLWQDETDQQLYDYDSFVCADFAEMLHNNAENAGIRAAYISIDFYSSSEGHALNAFNTTDKGMVYIDSTGTMEGNLNADKTVNLIIDNEYIPVSIFPNPGYEDAWGNMGQVNEIMIQW